MPIGRSCIAPVWRQRHSIAHVIDIGSQGPWPWRWSANAMPWAGEILVSYGGTSRPFSGCLWTPSAAVA